MDTIGKRIKAFRVANRLTQDDVERDTGGKGIGINQSTLSAIERTKKPATPGSDVVAKLLLAYPLLNPRWLLLDVGEMMLERPEDENRISLLEKVYEARIRALPATQSAAPTLPLELTNVEAKEREVLSLPAEPVAILSHDEIRALMHPLIESSELVAVKSERDNLRQHLKTVLDILGNRYGMPLDDASLKAAGGKFEASPDAADLRNTVDEIAREYEYRIVAHSVGFVGSWMEAELESA